MGVTSSFVKPTHRPSLLRRDITQDVGSRACLRACAGSRIGLPSPTHVLSLEYLHQLRPMENTCVAGTCTHTDTDTDTDTRTHPGSIYSSYLSAGTLVSKLGVSPAAKLSAITRPCLTPSWAQKLPHSSRQAPSFPRPSGALPRLLPSAGTPQKESSPEQGVRDWVTFLHVENSFPRIQSPVPALPPLPLHGC